MKPILGEGEVFLAAAAAAAAAAEAKEAEEEEAKRSAMEGAPRAERSRFIWRVSLVEEVPVPVPVAVPVPVEEDVPSSSSFPSADEGMGLPTTSY